MLKVSSYTQRYSRRPRIQGNHVDLGNILIGKGVSNDYQNTNV